MHISSFFQKDLATSC